MANESLLDKDEQLARWERNESLLDRDEHEIILARWERNKSF